MSPQSSDQVSRLRYLLTPPGDTRPSLLVELCPKVDDSVLREVREAMYGLSCANALVLDAEECRILHDTYDSMEPDSIKVDAVLETQRLLSAGDTGGRALEGRLERWLDALAKNWTAAIPREAWTKPLLSDVVPAAAGSLVRRTTAVASS